MNRYFYYLLFINSIANVILFLPRILTEERYHGALAAIALALPFGFLMLYLFTHALRSFPESTIADIVASVFPSWVGTIILLVYIPAWYMSGVFMLAGITDITQLFINPDFPYSLMLLLYMAATLFVILLDSSTILYGLEMFFLFNLAMLSFVFVRSVLDQDFNWDAVIEIGLQKITLPSLQSFAVTTYCFTGFTDMVIFNKNFQRPFQGKMLWLVPFGMLALMLFAFFIPIGLLGTEGVASFNHPFITSTDSLTMKMGIIERVFFIFLLIYVLTGLISVIIHWKVSLDLILSTLKKRIGGIKTRKPLALIYLAFIAIPILFKTYLNDKEMYQLALLWLSSRIFMEFLLVVIMLMAAKIKKKEQERIEIG